jgi:hypothetical protein
MEIGFAQRMRLREKIERLKASSFKQQTVAEVRQNEMSTSSAACYLFLYALIFFVLGSSLLLDSANVWEVEFNYNVTCKDMDVCRVDFTIEDKTCEAPIYFYYVLRRFYANHRRYVLSQDKQQYSGRYITSDDCTPITLVKDLKPNQQFAVATYTEKDKELDPSVVVGARKPLDPEAPAIPCGMIAKSIFDDKFRLFQK